MPVFSIAIPHVAIFSTLHPEKNSSQFDSNLFLLLYKNEVKRNVDAFGTFVSENLSIKNIFLLRFFSILKCLCRWKEVERILGMESKCKRWCYRGPVVRKIAQPRDKSIRLNCREKTTLFSLLFRSRHRTLGETNVSLGNALELESELWKPSEAMEHRAKGERARKRSLSNVSTSARAIARSTIFIRSKTFKPCGCRRKVVRMKKEH